MSPTPRRSPPRSRPAGAPVLAFALLVALAAAGGCGDEDAFGFGVDPDPGACAADPVLAAAALGDAALPPTAFAASCRFVVWLAPVADAPAGSAPQVHVHDTSSGATFRTTDPQTDAGAFGPGVAPARWSPVLHGFWLAYAEPEGVVVENLARFERARLSPAPRPGGAVALRYPWVAWEAAAEPGGTVIAALDMTTGKVRALTRDDQTAVGPGIDGDRLVYTLYPDDPGGAGDGLQGDARVELIDLADPAAAAVVVAPAAGSHRGGAIFDGVVSYVVRVDNVPRLVAVDAATLAPIASLRAPEVRSFNLEPVVGAGVVAWVTGGAASTVALWWPETGRTLTLPPRASAPRVAVGERVVVTAPAADGVHALDVLTLGQLSP